MRNETLFINDKCVTLLTSDQLTTDQIAVYSKDARLTLAGSKFNHPVAEMELADHMKAGRALVLVEHDSGLLLAHAFGESRPDDTTEIRGWFSKEPGLGGRILEAAVHEEKTARGARRVDAAVQTENEAGIRAITRIGGKPIELRPSRTPGKEVIVFNVTNVQVPARR